MLKKSPADIYPGGFALCRHRFDESRHYNRYDHRDVSANILEDYALRKHTILPSSLYTRKSTSSQNNIEGSPVQRSATADIGVGTEGSMYNHSLTSMEEFSLDIKQDSIYSVDSCGSFVAWTKGQAQSGQTLPHITGAHKGTVRPQTSIIGKKGTKSQMSKSTHSTNHSRPSSSIDDFESGQRKYLDLRQSLNVKSMSSVDRNQQNKVTSIEELVLVPPRNLPSLESRRVKVLIQDGRKIEAVNIFQYKRIPHNTMQNKYLRNKMNKHINRIPGQNKYCINNASDSSANNFNLQVKNIPKIIVNEVFNDGPRNIPWDDMSDHLISPEQTPKPYHIKS